MVSSKLIRNFLRKRSALPYKLLMYLGKHQNGEITHQRQLAKNFRRADTTINYHITKFKGEGLIDHHLELSNKGKSLFKFLWDNTDITKLRAHNIQIRFNLTQCPADYIEKYSKEIFSTFTNNRYMAFKGIINGITFMFYSPKKIICVIKDIFADNDEEISSTIQIIATDLKEILERKFVGIKISGHSPARIQTSHIAVLDAVLAKKIDLRGITFEGKTLAIDKSHGINEIEATDPSSNLRDSMYLLNLDGELRKRSKEDKVVLETQLKLS